MIKNKIIRFKLKSQAEMRKVILDKNSKKAEKVALEKEPKKVAKEQEENIEIKEKETKEKENNAVEKNRFDKAKLEDYENIYHYLENLGEKEKVVPYKKILS